MKSEQTKTAKFGDAHCHFDLFNDPPDFARKRASAKVLTVAVTNAPSVFFYTEKFAAQSDFIIPAVGLHPELARTHSEELDLLLELIDRVAVVGEVGLDFTEQDSSIRAVQKRIFLSVLSRCAETGERTLSVHSRRASAETISIIGPNFNCAVVMHWFSGSLRDLKQAISNGYYFSVNCAMSRSERGRRLLAEIPLERIIMETDAPFVDCCSIIAPGAHVIKELSLIWSKTNEEVAQVLLSNFCDVFVSSRR
jgi:TatD DNase family protein